jgi:hypothetical protein
LRLPGADRSTLPPAADSDGRLRSLTGRASAAGIGIADLHCPARRRALVCVDRASRANPFSEILMAHRLTKLLALALSGLIVAVTAGCGGNNEDDNPPPPPAAQTAQIRALHASASTPAVDVYVNGGAVAQNIAVGNQTGFATVPAAATRVQIAATGTPVSSAPIDVSVPARSTLRYSVVAIGDATQTSGPERLQAVVIEDDAAGPGRDNAQLRVVHGAPTAGPVDVFVTSPTAALPATPTIANLTFSSVSPAVGSPPLTLAGGEYRIRVRPAGQNTIVYDSGLIRLEPNTDLIAVAVRDVGPGPSQSPVQMLIFPSTGSATFVRDQRVSLRAAHYIANLPPVDVFLKAPDAANDAALNRIAAGLAYPSETAYLPFAQGTYDLSAALVNTANGILNADDVVLTRGNSYSAFAIGLLNGPGGQAPQWKLFTDDRTPVTGQAKVRVIHLAPDAPPVDVVTLNAGVIGQRLVTNLAYANATTAPLTVAPGTYTLAIVPTGANTPLLPSATGVNVTLAAGDVKTIVAVGALAPSAINPPAQAIQLRVLDDK